MKLTPLQPLSVAVDQARQKLNLVGVGSILKHGNSILDLNLPLRFAGLPAGAKLELQTGAGRSQRHLNFLAVFCEGLSVLDIL